MEFASHVKNYQKMYVKIARLMGIVAYQPEVTSKWGYL